MKMNCEPAKGSPRGGPLYGLCKELLSFQSTGRYKVRQIPLFQWPAARILMAKELRESSYAGSAKGETHAMALVIASGIRIADGEKYSAKDGNRGLHRSPGARDRGHRHRGFGRSPGPGPSTSRRHPSGAKAPRILPISAARINPCPFKAAIVPGCCSKCDCPGGFPPRSPTARDRGHRHRGFGRSRDRGHPPFFAMNGRVGIMLSHSKRKRTRFEWGTVHRGRTQSERT